jgi:hypothetical protein
VSVFQVKDKVKRKGEDRVETVTKVTKVPGFGQFIITDNGSVFERANKFELLTETKAFWDDACSE